MTEISEKVVQVVAITDDTQCLIDENVSTPDSSIHITQIQFGYPAGHYLEISPALLLIDCRHDDALELIGQIRALNPHIPIIAIVATNSHIVLDQVYAAGADDYLPLPIHPMTLARRLQHFSQSLRQANTTHDTHDHDVWMALYGLRQISHIYEIGRGLIRSLDLSTIYHLVYEHIVRRVLQVNYLNMALFDIEESCLRCEFAIYDNQLVDPKQFPSISLPNDWVQSLMTQQHAQIFSVDEVDTLSLPLVYTDVSDTNIPRSVLYMPLMGHDRTIGFLVSQDSRPDAFAELGSNLLTLLVSSVAVAIENARMHITNQQQIEELESLYQSMDFLFESKSLQDTCLLIAQAVVQSFEQADCGVLLVEAESGRLIRQGRAGDYIVHASQTLHLDGAGLVPEAIRTRQMLYVPDVLIDSRYVKNEPRTRSELVVPLSTPHGTVIGALDLQSMRIDAFSKSDRRLIIAFAERAALAIENAHILEKNQQQIKELESLYQSMDFLFDSKNLNESCERIALAVIQEFKQADCGILLLESDEQQIIRYGRAGTNAIDAGKTLHLNGQGLVPEAIRTGTMLYAPDVTTDPRYLKSDPRTHSELVVPLITPRGVIGALDLQGFDVDAFSVVDQRLIAAFAERAALALENMQLNDKIVRYVDELERRVTERTAELERARSHFEAIFNSSSDGKTVIKPDGTIVQSNPAFLTLMGLEVDCPGESLVSILRPKDPPRFVMLLQEVITTEESIRFEMTIENQDGAHLMVDVALYPILIRGGLISNLVCSLHDMTRQKQLEIELRQALAKAHEVNELRMRIVTTVSHEFRTPLTRILTSSDLLSNYGERLTAEQRNEKINKIRAGVFDMVRLLDDVLAVNDATSGKLAYEPDWYDLVELSREIIDKLKNTQQPQADCITFIDQAECIAWVDNFLYQKIVTELLTNAMKFTQENATIYCRLNCSPDEVVLSVEDNGIGIPGNDIERVFDTFYRGSNAENVPGIGLGLVVVKRAVELHGGTIDIVSNPENGTTFTVKIPQVGESKNHDQDTRN